MAKPKPKPVEPARTWCMTTDPKTGKGIMHCYQYPDNNCFVTSLWVTDFLTTFHDISLARATKEINAILSNVRGKNKDRKRNLAFIAFEGRLLLAWTHHDLIGPHDDLRSVIKAFGLKKR